VGDILFQPIITKLRSKHFLNDQVMKEAIQNFLEVRDKNFFLHTYTACPRRNVPDFGRVFLMLKYTDITQNTYVQS